MSAVIRFTDVIAPPPREGWPGPVSFEVREGAFVMVMTTPAISIALLRLMIGLREPSEGMVEVLGVRPGRLNRWDAQVHRRRLGVGFDEPSGLVSNLTLRMNLVVPMLYSGIANMATAQARATEILEASDLTRWADRRPADVPPDVRKEAVILRATVRDPELLLLEEPVGSLRDPRARFLLDLCRKRARTVFATTTEREGVQFERADTIISLDESGLHQVQNHEVGVI